MKKLVIILLIIAAGIIIWLWQTGRLSYFKSHASTKNEFIDQGQHNTSNVTNIEGGVYKIRSGQTPKPIR